MKKIITIELEECLGCPHLVTRDGFSSHNYFCPLILKESKEVTDKNSAEEVWEELTIWFEKYCPLETL